MKIIKPSFEIIEQQPGIEGLLKHIELAGRTCYKSEDKITEGSAKEFVERMLRLGNPIEEIAEVCDCDREEVMKVKRALDTKN